MENNAKKIGFINWIVLLGATIGMLLVTRFVSTAAGVMGTVLTGFGLLVALLSYFHMGLVEREQFEKMEVEELSKSRGSQSLFVTAGADTFPARRSREQFERIFCPIFTALLFLLQAAACYWPWEKLGQLPPLIADRATLAMALLGLFGLILFLLGKYSSGLARLQGQKLLRPGAAYLLLSAYACFAVTATIAAVLAGFPRTDLIVARVLCGVSGLAAAETLMALILEVYRVRLRGRETRLLYESRLVGLLGQPEAIISTAAHAMDYQFGFKVSETWFYRFLEKALGWMILAQFVALVLSSCFIVVQSGDEALLERFGRPLGVDGVIGPGLHFKLPWPIDQARVFHTERVQSFIVGAEPEQGQTIAWAVSHAKEQNFLVASHELNSQAAVSQPFEGKSPPVNLLSVSIPVQYQITNLAAWAYINQDPESLLKGISERAVAHYLASADLDNLMALGRAAAAVALRRNIQSEADRLELGTRVLFVGLEDIHPPTKVAKIFEQVVGARETRESKILQAKAYDVSTNAWANGESFKRVASADADEHSAITNSAALAMLFTNQQLAYSAAPGYNGVYEQHAYLEALINNSGDSRKYIIATTNAPNIIIFNLEEKIRKDLIDQLPAPPSK
ncbi:MAG TPA: SPFH domain-containing protein [Verrucomicrobiae bacterium]|jgi:regulator of protease activity HflC (stomatin/prohibitin superfamily)|nr:SPFH domain-containing protein [Verrucomicrobiae bacterium]